MFFTVGYEALTAVVTKNCIFWDIIQKLDPFMFLTLNLNLKPNINFKWLPLFHHHMKKKP
jgi:hypothetical protein